MEGLLGKILIVDDDENICEVIKMYLETTGYNVKVAHDGKAAKEEFVNFSPNLVVLDMMLPGIDGMEVLKWIRKDSNVPVIMLTAKGETFDKVLALEIGADDYVVKPFEPKELLARVKAVMRRYSGEEPDNVVLNFPGLTIDANSYKVIYNGEEVKTPPKEFELLHYLASNKNKVFTRDQLLCEVWGYDYPGDS
ncbi:TPA: response regulator transcription factor, partial [Clostridium perfringens]